MKLMVKGAAAERLYERLDEAASYFETPSTCTAWTENKMDPVTGVMLDPGAEVGERVTFKPGWHIVPSGTFEGRLVYRNCYGETLAVVLTDGILLTGRRHQLLYGAPKMSYENPATGDVEVIETTRPDVPWWQTCT